MEGQNYEKLFLATLVAAIAVPVIVAPETEASTKSAPKFSDNPKTHTYYNEITEMAALGIIQGF